jgi:peptide/nickel transport system substrate-binding protein
MIAAPAATATRTLRVALPSGVERLDPAAAPFEARAVVRLFARQLLTYEPRRDLRERQAVLPVPDAALAVPSTYNAGLGASHRSYVLHLRPDLLWDTTPPRRVTAADFVRGFKRLASPAARPAELAFFRSTIRGFAGFCDDFAAAVPATAPADELAAYQREHEIPGIFALDDEALVIETIRASPDVVHLLALPCASAAPVEYDRFRPDDPELLPELRSNGPYRVAAAVPGQELRLEPSPQRRATAQPDEIVVCDAGGDLGWGAAFADGSWSLDPYLAFNVAAGSPALRDPAVRRGVAAALAGCPGTAPTIVPPTNDAHRGTATRPAPTRPAGPVAAPPAGLRLVYEAGRHDAVARGCARGLAAAGAAPELVPLEPRALAALVRAPRAGERWDLLLHRLQPAWHSGNARVFLELLLAGDSPANVGGYRDDEVERLIARALDAATDHASRANAAWHAVEDRALEQAALVPLLWRAPALAAGSTRVADGVPVPALGYGFDLTTVRVGEEPA